VEVTWGEGYPDEGPEISLQPPLNCNIPGSTSYSSEARGRVSACGSPMTYSLFEFAKEHAEELVVVTETPAVPEQGPNTGKLCYRINMHDV